MADSSITPKRYRHPIPKGILPATKSAGRPIHLFADKSYAIVIATGNIYAGLWYPTIVAAIGFFVALLFLPETRARNIA